jgi:hypothetical protein
VEAAVLLNRYAISGDLDGADDVFDGEEQIGRSKLFSGGKRGPAGLREREPGEQESCE